MVSVSHSCAIPSPSNASGSDKEVAFTALFVTETWGRLHSDETGCAHRTVVLCSQAFALASR